MFCLNDLFLFSGLEDGDKDNIISSLSTPKNFKKGETIYSESVFPDAIGIVLKGEAFAVTNNQNRLYMNKFTVGTTFGAAAVFSESDNFVSTVTAKTDVTILFITENQLKEMFLKYPVTSLNYISFLSKKIHFLNQKVGLLSNQSAEDTVLNYLTSIADSNLTAQLPNNMTLLSKTLGISRASLYRCLDSLENNGFIIKEKNKVKVIKNEKNS